MRLCAADRFFRTSSRRCNDAHCGCNCGVAVGGTGDGVQSVEMVGFDIAIEFGGSSAGTTVSDEQKARGFARCVVY